MTSLPSESQGVEEEHANLQASSLSSEVALRPSTPSTNESKEHNHRSKSTPAAEALAAAVPTSSDIVRCPGPNDVLMGRGAPATDYHGNLRFRELVKDRRNEYIGCKRRKDKSRICGEVVDKVHSLGGRFLQKIEAAGGRNSRHPPNDDDDDSTAVPMYDIVNDRPTLLLKPFDSTPILLHEAWWPSFRQQAIQLVVIATGYR